MDARLKSNRDPSDIMVMEASTMNRTDKNLGRKMIGGDGRAKQMTPKARRRANRASRHAAKAELRNAA